MLCDVGYEKSEPPGKLPAVPPPWWASSKRVTDADVTSMVLTMGRGVFFALLGAAGLVLKRHYAGPHQNVVHSYGGNIAASFAVYFVVSNLRLHFHSRYSRLLTAAAALLVVELFEVTDGFGVMTNVYDRVDLVANAGGVAFALAVDAFTPNDLPPLPHHR